MQLCGGAPFGAPALVFRCHRTASGAFSCLSCGAHFQSLALERRYQSGPPPPRGPRPGATPPAAACGELAALVTSTSMGVHNISMDGRPIAQERAGLVADGLAVPCELAAEFGGLGLRYSASAPPLLRAGTVIGFYPAHAGMRTKAHHDTLPEMVHGALKGEYTLQLLQRMLYAERGRRGAGMINEADRPNVEFALVEVDLDDNPAFTVLALVATRAIYPGDFLHAYYGEGYAEVRAAKGYTVEPTPSELNISQGELEAEVLRAFTPDELLLLRGT